MKQLGHTSLHPQCQKSHVMKVKVSDSNFLSFSSHAKDELRRTNHTLSFASTLTAYRSCGPGFTMTFSTCSYSAAFELTSLFRKPTVALVYGALGCMTISGFRENIAACVVLMLESNRAQHITVRPHTGASEGATPVEEHAQSNKTFTLLS